MECEGITKVIKIHSEGNVNVYRLPYNICRDFTQNHKRQPHGCAKRKVRESKESLGFTSGDPDCM